jgi:hypothetical protein
VVPSLAGPSHDSFSYRGCRGMGIPRTRSGSCPVGSEEGPLSLALNVLSTGLHSGILWDTRSEGQSLKFSLGRAL